MEQQIADYLDKTVAPNETIRKQAELDLSHLHRAPHFGLHLLSVACSEAVPLHIRMAALLYLRKFVEWGWSSEFEQFRGTVLVSDEDKVQLRQILLDVALNCPERKLRKQASWVVSKIGSSDFPDEWPQLLPTALSVVQNGNEEQIPGALKLLVDLIDDSFNEEQFFGVAREMVNTVYNVAANEAVKPTTRALAVTVFRGCIDILEILLEEYKAQVKAFAEEAFAQWIPFLIKIMESNLPNPPSAEEDESRTPAAENFRSIVVFKVQVVKTLMRVRAVFPANLAPKSPELFAATWAELTALQKPYNDMFVGGDWQGRLEDDDGLPYTLDFLVLEELDLLQSCLKAGPVKKELEGQLKAASGVADTWVTKFMEFAVAYAQIPTEEEGMWLIDVGLFLSEETSVTTNYTPRTACGDFIVKLGEWLKSTALDALLVYIRSLFSSTQSWKAKEAALFLLNQLLSDFDEGEQTVNPETAAAFIEFLQHAIQQSDEFLRARGHIVAAIVVRSGGEPLSHLARTFFDSTLSSLSHDDSEIVKSSCVRALQFYVEKPSPVPGVESLQEPVIQGITNYMASQDMTIHADSDDFMSNIAQTVRYAILLNEKVCLTGDGLPVLFNVANYGAGLFMVATIVNETFEDVVIEISSLGPEAYAQLCQKVLPSLTGAFHISSLTDQNALTNLAADMLTILTKHGPEPLPEGLVATIMPKMNQILLESDDEELLKSSTCAVKNMLVHDPQQLFAWHDGSGKSGLEAILVIIDRLLGPTVDDNAGAEVGGLAAELVEKAGSEKLGPFLPQLLRAVAVRLGSAEKAQFIQSLILVFARLSLVSTHEVVDFLGQVVMGNENGLQVVLSKWLENSVNFAGYDEIRQNVIALSKIYDLHDPRITQIQVKGDLVVPQGDGRIMTRSRAKSQPDAYTIIPAPLKILKVLTEELSSATGSVNQAAAATAAAGSPGAAGSTVEAAGGADEEDNGEEVEEGSDDDADWEDDETNVLDLGLGSTKAELMAQFGDDEDRANSPWASRQRDDETQVYLTQWFRNAASNRPEEFAQMFNLLSVGEQKKLKRLVGG